ncbi:flagellar hook-length control protein FliK [Shewanella sp. Isolate7]|uniref:flagellar hook-length control protein FliK n=1 Tax=Shewanella sp. Isolate7 TaxID=2908528 RepID=UPI001EFCA51A|nr:flagellar hook-length control protein FliK [Shewanella sp. Isolate7]MCG9722280.1 flagellar hook-length control protein FliK [Shewanella sp. Isolate7]
MTQILLSNVESGKEKGGVLPSSSESTAESKSENKGFSEALAKVSNQDEKSSPAKSRPQNPGDNLAAGDSVAKAGAKQAKDSDQDKDSDDVSHVLAQIQLANKLGDEAELAADGVILPPGEGDGESSADNELFPSLVKGAKDRVDGEKEVLEGIGDSLKPGAGDDHIQPVINPNGLGSEAILAHLPDDALNEVVAQTGLSEDELMALPPQMLEGLIHGVTDKGKLAQGQGKATETDEANLAALISDAKKYLAALAGQSQTPAASSQVGPSQTAGAASDSPISQAGIGQAGLGQVESSQGGLASVMKANGLDGAGDDKGAKVILGEAKFGESKLGESKFSEAKLAVEQTQNSVGKLAEARGDAKGAQALLREANLSVAMSSKVGDMSDVAPDTKLNGLSIQGLQGARSEAIPQYQMSIKPQGEPVVQMQEMIQKFSPVMRQQLVAMVSQGVQQAEIRLDPPELGHMMVRVQVQGDQTQVQFHVTQTQTRDLVEQAIPRLRELLAEQGMQLTDSNVSQGGKEQDGSGEQGEGAGHGLAEMDEISAEESLLVSNNATSYRSGIDYYA